MQLPSGSCHRYFMVPSSLETCFRATTGGGDDTSAPGRASARRALGRSVISSKEADAPVSH